MISVKCVILLETYGSDKAQKNTKLLLEMCTSMRYVPGQRYFDSFGLCVRL